MKEIQNNLKAALKTILTIYAFTFDQIYEAGKSVLSQYANREDLAGFTWTVLGIAVFLLYRYAQNHYRCEKIQKSELLFAACYAVFCVVGRSFLLFNNWNLIMETPRQFFCALIAIIGLTCFFYSVLIILSVQFRSRRREKLNLPLSERHTLAAVCGILLIGWLPYIILTWPGSVPHDTMYQLAMWLGYSDMTNHHPWFTTMIYGVLFQVGRVFSDNIGVFLIILFQTVLCVAAFSHVCMKVKKYGGSPYITALFFALVPVWGCYVTAAIKDILFVAVHCVYFSYFLEIFAAGMGKAKIRTRDWVIFAVLSLLLCLIRNDGIYRVIPSGILLLFVIRQYRKQTLLALIACLIAFNAQNYVAFDIIGIQKGSSREMMSIPFQQTARYVRDCGDDVTEEEREAIDKVLPYDMLAEIYDPNTSDPVKNKMRNCTSEEFSQYLQAWAEMGMRHPSAYIQATINNTYYYFYPFHNSRVMRAYQNYIKGEPVNPGLDIHYVHPQITEEVNNYAEMWRVFPALSLLSNPGFYTWLLLFGIMILLKLKKIRELAVMSVPLLHLAICVASPVNGLLRYAMPLMAIMPLLLVWVRKIANEETEVSAPAVH